MKTNFIDKCLTVLYALSIVVLTVTFSIGLPIYFRPFYYVQIDTLNMVENTGYDYETIKEAYDEVLDYLTVPRCEFGTGELAHSEEGARHFADCKVLFDLNATAFMASLTVFLVLYVLGVRCRLFRLSCPRGFSPSFFSGACTLGVFALLAIAVAIDFDSAFVVFHSIFFPGKDNWLFDPRTDEIIRVMPAQFFMNCAILIVLSIIIISVTLIVRGITNKRRNKI